MTEEGDLRFLRVQRLLGVEALGRLRGSRVAVIGLGAVGGFAAEALVRSGLGAIRLVDFDRVQPSNLNRQLHALHSTLGRPKVEAMAERLRDIAPDCRIDAREAFFHDDSAEELLGDRPDLILDAIDSFTPKLALLTQCWVRNLPVLSAMGAALRQDPGAVRLDDLMDTHSCPLARRMRKFLRRRGVGRGITCVWSTEEVKYEYRDPQEEESDAVLDRGRERRVLGSLPTLPGIFGLTLAAEAIRRITAGSLRGPAHE